jgi:hypothetical protein
MRLHEYETTALQAGWDCTWCGRELGLGLPHYVDPARPGGAFCRSGCAAAYSERESRRKTAAPGQLGLAL